MVSNHQPSKDCMPSEYAVKLLEEVSEWQNTTTIILHGGSVFEFKGVFPKGVLAHGFYNLKGNTGFEGHLNLGKIAGIYFQDKLHRGRESYAFVFKDSSDSCIFKIFVGRDADGQLYGAQKAAFLAYQKHYCSGETR